MSSTETKACRICGPKPVADFYQNNRNKSEHGKGLHSYCKECFKESQWASALARDYGVTREWYFEQLAAQDGHCAICPATEPGGKRQRFCVDHDHATKKVRGLLCDPCNQGIGRFRDSPGLLQKAIEYLAHPPALIVPDPSPALL